MTHKQLVDSAAKWLRNSKRCPVVIRELVTYAGEIPDVIGFFVGGHSILIECKASKADFLHDREKIYRYCREQGMGDERYFVAPQNLLSPDEIPDAWGFIEAYENPIHPNRISLRIVKDSSTFTSSNKHSEITMLVSAIRRLELSTAVFVRQEDDDREG